MQRYRVNHDNRGHFVERWIVGNTWVPMVPNNFRDEWDERYSVSRNGFAGLRFHRNQLEKIKGDKDEIYELP
jgi:hypothetical protein